MSTRVRQEGDQRRETEGGSWRVISTFAGAFEIAGVSDLEGRKQREHCFFKKLRSKEMETGCCWMGMQAFNDGRDLIIFLGAGDGASREGALRMQEREGGIEEPA